MRIEKDSLGEIEVPEDAYWGAQTQRAIANFAISGVMISHFPSFLKALAQVKKAAALANRDLGLLSPEKAQAIMRACEDVMDGKLDHAFPLDVFQGGAGTSTNMNMNEVVANRALELIGLPRGRYDVIHPNNHVNLSQSTNDVYPTAIRLALLMEHETLRESLAALIAAFETKAASFSQIVKLGRTQLQDAVPMTLGQEFRAFAVTLREDHARLAEIAGLLREVNLGGTAIGTGLNAPQGYREAAIGHLAAQTALPLVSAGDLVEACWDTGAFVLFSAMLKRTATKLSKICNDLRLLSSGPRGGFCEIGLPQLQPGSSIMPGKVNPVIPEVVNQIAFQVIGADLTVTLAAEAGQLQLNVMEPVILYNLMTSISLLTRACETLRSRCVEGIIAYPDACRAHLENSTAVVTALVPWLGYDRAAALAKEILLGKSRVSEVLSIAEDVPDEARLLARDLATLADPLASPVVTTPR
ncbi:aspartate ammonia-lyase (plasmid) [Peteryoungia desertarenae]|uniref:Aspartate ammonia-lyase n=1 Tax=Peteryoungia desertarenae TaxID=1813451 RepID=A0ABX6QSM5_9HYPH|nr:aspartate ammonia-lyase [Peteryoungia desertarenae]QLF71473.1 aspartate ammonia-lyase [Peteryoungia desertarenae]